MLVMRPEIRPAVVHFFYVWVKLFPEIKDLLFIFLKKHDEDKSLLAAVEAESIYIPFPECPVKMFW